MHNRGCGYGTFSTLALQVEWSHAHLPAIDKDTGVPLTSHIAMGTTSSTGHACVTHVDSYRGAFEDNTAEHALRKYAPA